MNITSLKPISVIVPLMLIILAGCYPKTDGLQELYERQTALEAKIDKLSQELETGLNQISQDMDRVEGNQTKLAGDMLALKEKDTAADKRADKVPGKQNSKNSKSTEYKPKSPSNTPGALYTKAVTNYNDGRFEDAILDYQKLIDTYPRDKRVPEAYLKQGLSLINLGRKQEAKYFLNTLIDKYPNSQEAQTAREKLKTI